MASFHIHPGNHIGTVIVLDALLVPQAAVMQRLLTQKCCADVEEQHLCSTSHMEMWLELLL